MSTSAGPSHAATDSAVGYYYQALYALVVLLDLDDDAGVSIETKDDVEVVGPTPRLMQLKHSLGIPPALTEKNDGLWNTLGIWMDLRDQSCADFFFVTSAEIAPDSPLLELASTGGAREKAREALVREAKRVLSECESPKKPACKRAKQAGQSQAAYKKRRPPCQAFLNLSEDEQRAFLRRILILHRQFKAPAIEEEVERRLSIVTADVRKLLASRIVEWWDYRATRSLLGTAQRIVTKSELLGRINTLTVELSDGNLPDDFSSVEPADVGAEIGSIMEEQIALVDGGPARVHRAALARWRARQQRDRWLNERTDVRDALTDFDSRLVAAWRDRHGPLRDDTAQAGEPRKRAEGRKLLDWSHHDAPNAIEQPAVNWSAPFLTQGTYQQLAEEKQVGWHPDFVDRIPEPDAMPRKQRSRASRQVTKQKRKG